jgi:hypothetical protein
LICAHRQGAIRLPSYQIRGSLNLNAVGGQIATNKKLKLAVRKGQIVNNRDARFNPSQLQVRNSQIAGDDIAKNAV